MSNLYQTIIKATQNPMPGTTPLVSNGAGDDHVYLTVYDIGTGNNITVLYRSLSLFVAVDGKLVLTEAAYQKWADECQALRARHPKPQNGGYTPAHRKRVGGTWTRT